jgi:hypothetical protein
MRSDNLIIIYIEDKAHRDKVYREELIDKLKGDKYRLKV